MSQELIDFNALREISTLALEKGGLAKLLETFAADARRTLTRMHALARKGDGNALAFEAHRLRGSSASVGAVRFARECLALEDSARGGKTDLGAQIDLALAVLDSTQIVFSCFALGSKLEGSA